jgi:ferrous iron transport protein A
VAAEGAVLARLADLGFIPGTPVVMRRRAPLGDPAVYEIRGMQLCLRRGEAHVVMVEPAGV